MPVYRDYIKPGLNTSRVTETSRYTRSHIKSPLIFDGVSMTNLVEIYEFKKLYDIQIISITELKMTDRAACKYNEPLALRLNTRLLNVVLEKSILV